jgi:rhodanese-related sulfurtransferase
MKVAALALTIMALTFTVASCHTDVTPAQVKALLDAGGDLIVVDVREESEFCDSTYLPPGHIGGAVNMPWNSGYLQAHYSDLDPARTTIVVCRSGGRSNAAANFLDGVGFTAVYDMLGGMNAWLWETEDCSGASVSGPFGVHAGAPSLGPVIPNPFRSSTRIACVIPATQDGRQLAFGIYDSRGRLVTTLADGDRASGVGHITWDGTDQDGHLVASGVYFSRLTWNGTCTSRRIVLIR